jgi:uncharacterized protein YkwD
VVEVPTGSPPRHRVTGSGALTPGHRPVRRARYLLCGLLVVPALIAGGLYLAQGSGPGASPSAPGTAVARATADPCGAAAGPCAGSPIRVAIATVPASARAKRPAARPAPSPSASSRSAAAAGTPPGSPASQQGRPAEQVVALINQARAAAGLPPLTVTAGLVASASAHNMLMAEGCGLLHQCPGEPPLGARESAAGVHWTTAGENLGEGGPVADTTAAITQMAIGITQYMLNETPPNDGHRLNILSSAFTHIGVVVYRASSGTVWMTQDFSN